MYIEHKNGSMVKTALPSITVMALISDGMGGMWAGTYNQGRVWSSSPIGKTVIFDPKDETTRLVTTDSGDDIHANAIRYDGANTMQLGSVYGLWTYDLRNGKCDVAFGNQKGTQQWMNQMVTDVKADRQQGMMLLTHPDGITIFDTKQDTLYYIRRTDNIIKGMTPTEFRQKQSDNEI